LRDGLVLDNGKMSAELNLSAQRICRSGMDVPRRNHYAAASATREMPTRQIVCNAAGGARTTTQLFLSRASPFHNVAPVSWNRLTETRN
jgi:hypothetical protein